MRCRDGDCEPDKGDEGCMAYLCNPNAVDGLDVVWVNAWNDCPVIAAQSARSADLRREQDAEWAHYARLMEADGAS